MHDRTDRDTALALLGLFAVILIVFAMISQPKPTPEPTPQEPIVYDGFVQVGFTAVGKNEDVFMRTVYDVETKVMYVVVVHDSNNDGSVSVTMVPLYNADGSLRVWKDE